MKVRAGKVKPRSDNEFLARYYAMKALERKRETPAWKLAAACATTPFLIVGVPQR